GVGSALPHLPQRLADPQLGLAGLPLALALLPFEALDRCQKPRRVWLAIDHGECSFPLPGTDPDASRLRGGGRPCGAFRAFAAGPPPPWAPAARAGEVP